LRPRLNSRKIPVMAMARRQDVTEEQLQGFKYFKKFLPMLNRLHDAATARDRAGNRVLHFDQYIALMLIFFFNPTVTSMRGLVQASHLRKAKFKLGVAPTNLGSFSEAGSVFDAELLKPIIAELGAQLRPMPHDHRLDDLPGILTAVDGSELKALSSLADHLLRQTSDSSKRGIKIHAHFEPLTGVPTSIDVTGSKGREVDNLLARLLPNRVYVQDRGYACFRLLQAIEDIGSHFVCRVRDNSVYHVIETRELPEQTRAAGVLCDQIVQLGCEGKRDELKQPLRLIRVACKPHRKRSGKTGRSGPEQGDSMLIATNLTDLSAEVISLIYRKRWTIELFFRFFKQMLGCRHLLSHRKNGIEIQVYVAIIACMLIALWTGRKPTKRTLEMIQFYFMGWATLKELEAHIKSLKPSQV